MPESPKPKQSLRDVLTSPRVWLMFALGFASGLPLYLTGTTLSAWMTKEGLSLKTIGFFSAVGFPYVFKFLWAPLMDRYVPPFLGRRRGWMLVTQVLVAIALLFMAQTQPAENLTLLAVLAVLVAFASASQDVASDAYRTDILLPEERPLGITTHALGYRVGMVFAMSFALIIADNVGWRVSYSIMAVCMVVGVVATLLGREPAAAPPKTLFQAVVLPFRDFFTRGWPALVAMAFILLFRVGDAVAARMTTPYVLKLGFSLTQVGAFQKFGGMAGAILGTIAGGLLINALGLKRSLFVFGAAQASTNLLYVLLGRGSLDPWFLALCVGVDNFAGGMGSAAMGVFIMGLCNKRFSATQFALLSSLASVPMILLGTSSGVLAESLGWPTFFLVTALAIVPALVLVLLLPRDMAAAKEEPPAPVDAVLPLPAAAGHGPAVGNPGRERTTP